MGARPSRSASLASVLVLAALCAGCEEEVAPASYVDKFRVLSVTATPPDLRPGELTFLRALAVDPTRPDKKNTLVWLACDPDPLDLTRSSCSDVSTLSDPAAFTPPEGGDLTQTELPPGVRPIGFGDLAVYQAPAGVFDLLAADDPRRVQGAVAQVLIIAIASELPASPTPQQRDELFRRVREKEIASTLVIFRVRVTEDAERNSNPGFEGFEVAGELVPRGATLRFFSNRPTPMVLTAPAGDYQEYSQLTPDGVERRREKLLAALYSTTGRFNQPLYELGTDTELFFEQPDGRVINPIPEDRRGTLWAVLRDTRGGQSFTQWPFFLCDEKLPRPEVASVEPSQGPADGSQIIRLRGQGLESVLDVLVSGQPLQDARYDEGAGVFEGRVPALAPGEHALLVRGKHCANEETTVSYRSP